MPTLYLFADSNLFLHYKPLHQIEWSQIGGFDVVEVVVCRTVQREIDALKDGREGRRTDRARRAASIFLEIAQNGPQERRAASPRVVLSLYGTSQPKADLGEQLDYSQNDDRIIGHLAQFREENPLADARLLTRDSGPVLTAGSLGIPCVVIPDEWRLASEPDDRERNIQELTRQLQELQAQEPEFQFSCEQQSDERPAHVEIVYEAFQPLTETETRQVVGAPARSISAIGSKSNPDIGPRYRRLRGTRPSRLDSRMREVHETREHRRAAGALPRVDDDDPEHRVKTCHERPC